MRNRTMILGLDTAQFVTVLDSAAMNVLVPQVMANLHATVSDIQPPIAACTLVMIALCRSVPGLVGAHSWKLSRAGTCTAEKPGSMITSSAMPTTSANVPSTCT